MNRCNTVRSMTMNGCNTVRSMPMNGCNTVRSMTMNGCNTVRSMTMNGCNCYVEWLKERKFRWLKFSHFFILGENCAAISSSLFPIGYDKKVRVKCIGCKRGYHTRKYDKDV